MFGIQQALPAYQLPDALAMTFPIGSEYLVLVAPFWKMTKTLGDGT